MATSYMTVYNRFLEKVTDYFIFNLSDEDTCRYCHGLLMSALANITNMDHNLNNIDEELEQFNDDLTNTELEYIAGRMVCEWINPQINNTTLLRQYIGEKDEKFYAPANQLNALVALKDNWIARTQKIIRDWHFNNSEYFT